METDLWYEKATRVSSFLPRKNTVTDYSDRYVNFACGDETAEEIYGYDGRVDKLKALKAKWDPEGHFNQYNSVFK
jgi:hypothetical protein